MTPAHTRKALLRLGLDLCEAIEDRGADVAISDLIARARSLGLIERGGLFGAGLTCTADVLDLATALAAEDRAEREP